MQLSEFFNYKNQLADDLLTNESIVKLLNDDATLENAGNLMYTQVFPYEYIPETAQKGNTFLCIDVDIVGSVSKTVLNPVIYIWIFAHKSNLRLPDGKGVRTDALCSEICKAINGSKYYGLGELELTNVRRFAPMTDYNGKLMTFSASEINRYYDPHKSVPSKRY